VPLVAVAAACLLLGVRALVGLVVPLLLLTLTWPLPLRALLEPAAGRRTALTSGALRLVLQVLPLAATVDVPGDLRLSVAGPSGTFDVVVASACSGLTGIGGTLLVGGAAQYVLHGSARARVQWLSTAVVLAWVLNLVRILLLLAVGRLLGEQVALEVVHPLAGLLLLNVSFAGLLLVAPRFGLRLALASPVPADTPLTDPAPVGQRAGRRPWPAAAPPLPWPSGSSVRSTRCCPRRPARTTRPSPPHGVLRLARSSGRLHDGPGQAQPWSRVYYGRARTGRGTGSSRRDSGRRRRCGSTRSRRTTGRRCAPTPCSMLPLHGFSAVPVSRSVLTAGVLADEVVYRRPDGATWHVLSWSGRSARPADRRRRAMRHERVVLLASSQRSDLAPGHGRAGDDATTPGTGLRALLAARWGARDRAPTPTPR
jgi:exosortase/archaeosortase family protein